MQSRNTSKSGRLCKKSAQEAQLGCVTFPVSNLKSLSAIHNHHSSILYDESYADSYESFYLHPWMKKHQLNVENIKSIFSALSIGQLQLAGSVLWPGLALLYVQRFYWHLVEFLRTNKQRFIHQIFGDGESQ